MSSTTASDNSATTSELRMRCDRGPSLPRAVSFSALVRSTAARLQTGREADENAAGEGDDNRERRDAGVEPRV